MPRSRDSAGRRRPKRKPRNGGETAPARAARREGDGIGRREATGEAGGVARVADRAARSRPVRRLLEGIGAPRPAPFMPDPFQLEALAALEHKDVLVTAPTGSGKTWIAREEIRRLLAAGRRAWYTSPLKALTNSKYQEFADEFGSENVGILTGDRKEKANAPLIVGTTEVYRNQLFDALRNADMRAGVQADLVVLDEAHYLADEERGHVWEEGIILTPPRVRLLLLSATVGNAEEFAEWIAEVRGRACEVVTRHASGGGMDKGGARPVPLRAAFLFPEGELVPLFDEAGRYNPEIARFFQTTSARQSSRREGERRTPRRANMPEMPPSILLTALRSYDLLPAIVFLPTRRRCDEAASEAALAARAGTSGGARSSSSTDAERREARRAMLREVTAQYPEVSKHRHYELVVRGGVASHHAGHLPAWKLAIERLMSAGLLDAIFATTTVAAGVDFPARTVALTNIDIRTGRGWRSLTASELQQMTGRAGRRGRDRVGFIVAAPGTHQDPLRLATLLNSPPDPLESQFRATYTTLLNLLDAYGNFGQVREIAGKSFAHREAVEQMTRLARERDASMRRIDEKLRQANCSLTPEHARGLERLASARARLLEGAPQTRGEAIMRWLDKEVVPGRVVTIGRQGRRLVFVTERRGAGLVGVREDGRRAALALERIGRIYGEVYPLAESAGGGPDAAFADARAGRAGGLLNEPRLREARASVDEAVALINDLIDRLGAPAGLGDEDRGRCQAALWSALTDAESAEMIERRSESLRGEVWQPFERRARVLDHFGYLDYAAERVTTRGRWLADLRLDRPLLVGEALERGLFASLDAARAAGLMAALTADAERDYGELALDDTLVTTLARFEQMAYEVASIEWKQELDPAPEINFSAAAAATRWAGGAKWDELVRQTRAEEGDLFRMLSRTGESLLQIGGLEGTHAEAARVAASAAEMVLREPVRTDEML